MINIDTHEYTTQSICNPGESPVELQQGECLGKLDSVTVLSLLSDEEVMKGHVEAET